METYSVKVLKTAHANCDSLPLRFGIHFKSDQVLTLAVVKDLGRDSQHPNRFHLEAKFKDPTNPGSKEQLGHFVLEQGPSDRDPSLVTVWRGDRDTEWGLSDTMTKMRRVGFLKVEQLLELHPLYLSGKVVDSAGLVQHLSHTIAKGDIQRFQEVAAKAQSDTALAIKNMELARQESERLRLRNENVEAVAREAIDALESQDLTIAAQSRELEELRARVKDDEARYKSEEASAKSQKNVATLSVADALVEVRESVLVRGSLCTVLLMSDGRTLHMKTSTFDPDGEITKKARGLIGSRVRTTCWDPISAPGKWSSQGYFRNIYLVE